MYADAGTMALPGAEFFPRWLAHLCAASFVFLMGTSLALSVERRVAKGVNAWEIDKSIVVRGLIIALFDLTLISFGSGRWTFGILMGHRCFDDMHGTASPPAHMGAAGDRP
jgi:uncharacterized membrane protein